MPSRFLAGERASSPAGERASLHEVSGKAVAANITRRTDRLLLEMLMKIPHFVERRSDAFSDHAGETGCQHGTTSERCTKR